MWSPMSLRTTVVYMFGTLLIGTLLIGVPVFAHHSDEPVTEQEAEYMSRRVIPPAVDAWMQQVGLGPYETHPYWMTIVERAEAEGEVVLYATTSRILALEEEWNRLYPNIQLRPFHVETGALVDRFDREFQAGIFNADVIMLDGIPAGVDFWLRGMLHKYVPPRLENLVPPGLQELTLRHRWGGGGVLYYNTEAWPDGPPPITNVWQLTEPEYDNQLIMTDPLQHASTAQYMAEFLYEPNAERLAAAYERHFGRPIDLNGRPNAGYVFIEAISRNARLTPNDTQVVNIVGARGQSNPPIGLWVTGSKMRDVTPDGPVAAGMLIHDDIRIDPVDWISTRGVDDILSGQFLAIAGMARHPNAARLLIDFLMGDEDGLSGNAPWRVIGNVSPRTDLPPLPGDVNLFELQTWSAIPVDQGQDLTRDFLRFWTEVMAF